MFKTKLEDEIIRLKELYSHMNIIVEKLSRRPHTYSAGAVIHIRRRVLIRKRALIGRSALNRIITVHGSHLGF